MNVLISPLFLSVVGWATSVTLTRPAALVFIALSVTSRQIFHKTQRKTQLLDGSSVFNKAAILFRPDEDTSRPLTALFLSFSLFFSAVSLYIVALDLQAVNHN